MERKIGEVFTVNGETLIVVEEDSEFCYNCYLFQNGKCDSSDQGSCISRERSDGCGVIFKKVKDIKLIVDTTEDNACDNFSDNTDYIPEVRYMDFSRVLYYLKAGATARRESWSGNKSIFLAKGTDDMLPFICINTKDGHKGVYTITACDLLAEDWIIIET